MSVSKVSTQPTTRPSRDLSSSSLTRRDSPESAFDPETERTAKEQAILDQAMQEVSRELDPLEHRVLQMMFGPSRASVEQIASAVGAGHLSLDERRRAAKQVTERITKRIKRVAARLQSEAS